MQDKIDRILKVINLRSKLHSIEVRRNKCCIINRLRYPKTDSGRRRFIQDSYHSGFTNLYYLFHNFKLKNMEKSDFTFNDEGTVIFLTPVSERAFKWSSENISLRSWQDKNQIPIEPRMFDDIAEGIKEAGLTIEKY